jgi:hypothetical protein
LYLRGFGTNSEKYNKILLQTGGQLLMKHKGSLGRALMDLFPEVSFDRTKFKSIRMFIAQLK